LEFIEGTDGNAMETVLAEEGFEKIYLGVMGSHYEEVFLSNLAHIK